MKQVLEIYGKFLLEAAVLLLLLFLLMFNITDGSGNFGIFEIIGSYLHSEDDGLNQYNEFHSYESECSRAAPAITYVYEEILYTGRHVMQNYIRAEDSNGDQIPVKVLSITDQEGGNLIEQIVPGDAEIEFPVPGIYSVKISATDEWNKKTVCTVKIPVNRG